MSTNNKRAAFAIVLAILLAGCANSDSISSGNARTGSLLYVKARCLSCHRVNGVGGSEAPDLTHNITGADFQLLRYYIENPPKGMEYVRNLHLSDTDIHNLNAFMDSELTPQGSTSSASSEASAGAKLYTADRCIDCHVVNGAGGTSAPDLTNNPTMTSYSLLKAELDTPPPGMEYVTKLHLTAKQIRELSSFGASSLKPAPKK